MKTTALLLTFAASLPAARAASILVTNYDMESAPTARADGAIGTGIATGWTGSGTASSFYTFNTTTSTRYYNDPSFLDTGGSGGASGTMAGPNFTGVSSSGTSRMIEQTLSATLQADTQYTLTASFGHRTVDSGAAATASQVTIELLAGGVTIATATVDPSTGIWSDAGALQDDIWADGSATGTTGASPAQLGQPLVIRFTKAAAGDYMDIDNVRLTATAVPEPSVVLLSGFAALALVRRRVSR